MFFKPLLGCLASDFSIHPPPILLPKFLLNPLISPYPGLTNYSRIQPLEACTFEEATPPLEPPQTPELATVLLVSGILEGAPWHPGLASCQTCHPAQVNGMVSVRLGKLWLGQARLLPGLPQRLTTVHVRVVS